MAKKAIKKNTEVSTRRPPVIVVMGHIDHGKSTLLDYIRQTKVVESEAGGITQAVSAYEVERTDSEGQKRRITFIDTPGHEAFGDIRERSAGLADIAILIVSAEEGVKPQTLEALKAIQKQDLPYVVAINKIDRPNTNPDTIKQELAEAEVLVEGYGGDIPWAAISAKTGAGVEELLDLLLLTAELAELKGDPKAPGTGVILETNLDPKSGNSAVLIIKDGILHVGDYLVASGKTNKVRSLQNFLRERVKELSFSSPALLISLSNLPPVGATFTAYGNRREAEKAAEAEAAEDQVQGGNATSNTEEADKINIPIIIKADVAGSLGAVKHELAKLETPEVGLKLLDASIGTITETDIKLARATEGALVLGFNVEAVKAATELAETNKVVVHTFDIIYKLSEWLAEEIKRRTPLKQVENEIGRAKILKVFGGTKNKQVIGGNVLEGKLMVGKQVKILRRDSEIDRGKIVELQEQKLKTKEVQEGNQFGALVETKATIAAGDQLVAFDLVTQ
ncbi:MAG: translation initiation factor IF-2 [Patescibacteria group bacterium]|nr:translation initiation factor IF-2 [Patescibacteria group bacterium]